MHRRMSRLRYVRWITAGCALALAITLGYWGVWHVVSRTRGMTALYIFAAVQEPTPGEERRLRVDVFLNDRLLYRAVPGHRIPIVNVRAGRYNVRASAPGYRACTESVTIPRGTSESYVYCELVRSGIPRSRVSPTRRDSLSIRE